MPSIRKPASIPAAHHHYPAPFASRGNRTAPRPSRFDSEQLPRYSHHGIVYNSMDALLLVDAARNGRIPLFRDRIPNATRAGSVVSGSIFVYEVVDGLKRWTDGKKWSPSRVLGPFLIYREPFLTNEDVEPMPVPAPPLNDHEREAAARRQKLIRSWVVSLEDYSKTNKGIINPDGLVKRTFAINDGETNYHVVSYYHLQDALNERFTRPENDPFFRGWRTCISQELLKAASKSKYPIKCNVDGDIYSFARESSVLEEALNIDTASDRDVPTIKVDHHTPRTPSDSGSSRPISPATTEAALDSWYPSPATSAPLLPYYHAPTYLPEIVTEFNNVTLTPLDEGTVAEDSDDGGFEAQPWVDSIKSYASDSYYPSSTSPLSAESTAVDMFGYDAFFPPQPSHPYQTVGQHYAFASWSPLAQHPGPIGPEMGY